MAAKEEEGGVGFRLLLMVFAVTQKSPSLSENEKPRARRCAVALLGETGEIGAKRER